MKVVYLIILVLLFNTSSYTANYYVDNTASGSNNGTSWADAWESFAAIVWDSLDPGDFLYISGGTDSTVYYETLTVGASGTAGNHITIRNSYDTGHNGRVVIDGGNNTRTNGILIGSSSSNHPDYVYVKGFEIRRSLMGVYLHYNTEVITLDSLTIYDFYGQAGVKIVGNNSVADGFAADSVIIKNCTITTFVDIDGQTDCIYAQYASNIFLYNNFIHEKNSSLINNHSDAIQSYRTRGWKIWDNVVIADSGVQGMAIILGAESTDNDSVIIYNNFFYMGGIWFLSAPDVAVTNTRWYSTNSMPPTSIIHNTIVSRGPSVDGLRLYYPATIKNNIIVQYGVGTGYDGWLSTMKNDYATAHPVDSTTNNLIWREWGDVSIAQQWTGNGNTGSVSGWSSWTGTYGGTGVNSDPLFVDDIGNISDQSTLDGELQSGSPAINAGIDVQAIVEGMGLPWTDINGVARDSTPDIGAYQYEAGETTNPTKLIMKK